mmetsp:Transcript_18597/g.53768  ORF Transcript_18597/g.53768 Transcript_18597/m.53768 type:complete len:257 (-) Transcript_18597:1543-2313(-)
MRPPSRRSPKKPTVSRRAVPVRAPRTAASRRAPAVLVTATAATAQNCDRGPCCSRRQCCPRHRYSKPPRLCSQRGHGSREWHPTPRANPYPASLSLCTNGSWRRSYKTRHPSLAKLMRSRLPSRCNSSCSFRRRRGRRRNRSKRPRGRQCPPPGRPPTPRSSHYPALPPGCSSCCQRTQRNRRLRRLPNPHSLRNWPGRATHPEERSSPNSHPRTTGPRRCTMGRMGRRRARSTKCCTGCPGPGPSTRPCTCTHSA